MKDCPHCGRQIQQDAISCRFCRQDLPPDDGSRRDEAAGHVTDGVGMRSLQGAATDRRASWRFAIKVLAVAGVLASVWILLDQHSPSAEPRRSISVEDLARAEEHGDGDSVARWWNAQLDSVLPGGMRVAAVDTGWVGAVILDSEMRAPGPSWRPFRDTVYAFQKGGDFNADGQLDRAFVGVYRTRAGVFGRFLLISTKREQTWVPAGLATATGGPGFSSLAFVDSTFMWALCQECDDIGHYRWTGHDLVRFGAGED